MRTSCSGFIHRIPPMPRLSWLSRTRLLWMLLRGTDLKHYQVSARVALLRFVSASFMNMAEDVPGCLAGASSCVPSRNCEAVTGFDRACLSAAVPWRVPYARIRCCFRCCLAHWQRRLGLDAVFGQWEREQRSDISKVNNGWWELPAASEVLYMHSSPFAWAPIRALAPARSRLPRCR